MKSHNTAKRGGPTRYQMAVRPMQEHMTVLEFAMAFKDGVVAWMRAQGEPLVFRDEERFAQRMEVELGLQSHYCAARGRLYHVALLAWAFAPSRE